MIRLCSKESVGRVEPWVCLVAMLLLYSLAVEMGRWIAAGMSVVMCRRKRVCTVDEGRKEEGNGQGQTAFYPSTLLR